MSSTLVRDTLRVGIAGFALASTLTQARAGDWYVDAVGGSNANPGTSSAAPWRTITHALASIAALPIDVQTVHVAPGVYDVALGEVFPLRPPPRTRVVGTAGSAQTIVDGNAGYCFVYNPHATVSVDAQSGVDGFTLRHAITGLLVGSGSGSVAPSFHDLRVENTTGPGVQVSAASEGPFGGASARAVIERLQVVGCNEGIRVQASGGGLGSGSASIELTDCVVRGSAGNGLRFSASGNAGANVRLHRGRIQDNSGHGAYGTVGGEVTSATLVADASEFVGNLGSGLFSDGANGSAFGQVTLVDCTVADNAEAGVRGLNNQRAVLQNSILARNGDDLDVNPGNVTASFTDCANGDLVGFPNCIAADPQFVAPTSRDYRLRFSSPCIDTGDLASAGAQDLLFHVRPYDGDLDTVALPDMGAHEFAPLALVGVPRIGATIGLEITGPAGAATTLYSSRNPLVAVPAQTAFGWLWMPRRTTTVYAQTFAQPGPPSVETITLTNAPSWVGRVISFQARIASAAAPSGAAFSNPVSFVLLP